MEEDDQEDALLLLFVLSALQLDVDDSIIHLDSLLVRHIREQHRLNRALPMDKTRTTWSAFSDSLSDNHFRRMKLATHELKRPMLHDMKYNSYGHIYLDS
jgi:hypothetical protein